MEKNTGINVDDMMARSRQWLRKHRGGDWGQEPSSKVLRVWVCYRGDPDGWEGSLIIAAHDEDEAFALFKMGEENDVAVPHLVIPMHDVWAAVPPRILYNDDAQ